MIELGLNEREELLQRRTELFLCGELLQGMETGLI